MNQELYEVEYIEINNDNCVYFDTDVLIKDKEKIVTIMIEKYSSPFVNIVTNQFDSSSLCFTIAADNNNYLYRYNSLPIVYSPIVMNTVNNKVEIVVDSKEMRVNGESVSTGLYGSYPNDNPLRLFKSYLDDETTFKGKFYFMKVEDIEGNVISHLVPVVKNGIGYMYDKIGRRLYGNNGDGNFIVGPKIK